MSAKGLVSICAKYPFGIGGILLCLALVLTAAFADLDLFQLNVMLLESIEQHEVDDLAVGFLVMAAGLGVEAVRARQRKRRELEIAEQRLRVLKATMRTVQDLVNNFLNDLHSSGWRRRA